MFMKMDEVFRFRRRMAFALSGVFAGVILLTGPFAPPLEAANANVSYASGPEVTAMFLKFGRIEYPWRARATYRHGTGVFRMYINPDGKVRTVGVLRSTGHSDLDLAAAPGLYHCLLKSGRRREVDMPVTFTFSRPR